MSIQYTYTIESVDTAARCMVVIYEAQGHATQRVGTRIPFEGETLTDVIASFAPVSYWEDQVRELAVPVVGATGVVEADVSLPVDESVSDTPQIPINTVVL